MANAFMPSEETNVSLDVPEPSNAGPRTDLPLLQVILHPHYIPWHFHRNEGFPRSVASEQFSLGQNYFVHTGTVCWPRPYSGLTSRGSTLSAPGPGPLSSIVEEGILALAGLGWLGVPPPSRDVGCQEMRTAV